MSVAYFKAPGLPSELHDIPLEYSAAAFAVEKINGPVLTLCGGADQLWNSCRYSQAIQHRLQVHGSTFPDLALSYPDAGHAIDFPMPYEPFGPLDPEAMPTYGSTPTANDQARGGVLVLRRGDGA